MQLSMLLALFLMCYIVYRFRAVDEKLNTFKRSMDSRLTHHDIDHLMQLVRQRSEAEMRAYVDEKLALREPSEATRVE